MRCTNTCNLFMSVKRDMSTRLCESKPKSDTTSPRGSTLSLAEFTGLIYPFAFIVRIPVLAFQGVLHFVRDFLSDSLDHDHRK